MQVCRLYRHSLKCMMSWAIDRDLINVEGIKIRRRFDANLNASDRYLLWRSRLLFFLFSFTFSLTRLPFLWYILCSWFFVVLPVKCCNLYLFACPNSVHPSACFVKDKKNLQASHIPTNTQFHGCPVDLNLCVIPLFPSKLFIRTVYLRMLPTRRTCSTLTWCRGNLEPARLQISSISRWRISLEDSARYVQEPE